MSDLVGALFTVAFVSQVARIMIPYVLAALGGVASERAGVVDLSLEGKLLVAALAAAIGADLTGDVVGGVVAGVVAGGAYGAIYGAIVLGFRADQIVAGVAMNLMAVGLTRYLSKLVYGSTANTPRVPGFEGGLLGNGVFWLALAAPFVLHLALARTRFGLRLRAVGEHPDAATSLGVSVLRVRGAAILLSGALTGLGGAWLSLSVHGFVGEMSGGRGYIALAAVIMGRWRPLPAAAACLFFGITEAPVFKLGLHELGVPRELIDVVPYLLTIGLLAGFIGRSRPPAALGRAR